MKFETRMTWDAPLSRVIAMLTDRRYFEYKHALMAHEAANITACTLEGDRFSITTRVMRKPSIKVPALAQKFIKSDQSIEIEQTDSWDRATGRGSIQVANKSVSQVSVSAEMQLREIADGTENVIRWTVDCSLPLIGGKLAAMLADDIRAKADHNQQVSREILNAHF